MNDLLRIAKKHRIHIGLVSHLRKTVAGGKSFEEGKMPSLDDVKGCLGHDTEVLLANGRKIKVQDIEPNTLLIGGDGNPCKVLQLKRGKQQMYKVKMKTSDDSFICNEDHILTLSHNDKTFNISVKEFLNQSYEFRFRCKQSYSKGYELPEKEVLIPPYSLGAWLGDGSKAAFRIMDAGELGIVDRVAFEINAVLKEPSNRNREYYNFVTDTKGEMLEKLRDLKVLDNKHIPECYKYNSRSVRLNLLAGLIDTDGTFNTKDKAYYFWQKDGNIAYDVSEIARSLGFYSTIRNQVIQSNYSSNGSIINCVIISGEINDIPCRKGSYIKRHTDALKRGITIEKLDEQDYYGFTLDNDGRFLLGNHIITHNSGSIKQVALDIIAFARDMSHVDEKVRNLINMSVLKCRATGLTGPVQGARYDFKTGRMNKAEIEEW
jgi:replicative DNA helicase